MLQTPLPFWTVAQDIWTASGRSSGAHLFEPRTADAVKRDGRTQLEGQNRAKEDTGKLYKADIDSTYLFGPSAVGAVKHDSHTQLKGKTGQKRY